MTAKYLSDSDINTVIRLAPLVSIDLIIRDAADRILLGLRNNEPAKGYFFVPGGIILKDETLADAFTRIMQKEISRPDARTGAAAGRVRPFLPNEPRR